MSGKSIQQDIVSWLEGDEQAYRTIFNYFYPKLLGICLRSVKQREDAEEMVMNVFLNIWRHREQVLKINSFEGYVFAALRNQITDFNRKNVLPTEDIDLLPLEKLGSIDHPELSLKELELFYQNAVDKLPGKRREVFLMSREQGLSHQQIADQNDITVNTVNNHIKSAMKIIRDDLRHYSEALLLIIIAALSNLIR